MKYIVYCTRNNKNSKIYIGVHGTKDPFNFDGYLGCGLYDHSKNFKPKTAFQKALKKYKANNFTRITLRVFENEDDAYSMEALLVDVNFVKRRDTYNLVVGGKFNGSDVQKRPVAQYSLEGILLEIFESHTDAANASGSTPSEIGGAVSGRYKTSKGFVWKDTKNGIIPIKIEVKLPRIIGVTQYSKAGYRMKTWPSIKDASNHFNCDSSTISAICKGKPNRITIAGFQWRYETDGLESIPACGKLKI